MKKRSTLGVLAFLFIIAGLILTLENYSFVSGISKQWPSLILLMGIGFVMLFFDRKKNDPVLMWIGSFLMMLSVLFYYLNITSWTLLVHLWPFFLGFIGLSFFIIAVFTKKKVFKYLSVCFLALFLILFFVFGVALRLWPVSLIIFGLSLLIIDYFNARDMSARVKKRGKK